MIRLLLERKARPSRLQRIQHLLRLSSMLCLATILITLIAMHQPRKHQVIDHQLVMHQSRMHQSRIHQSRIHQLRRHQLVKQLLHKLLVRKAKRLSTFAHHHRLKMSTELHFNRILLASRNHLTLSQLFQVSNQINLRMLCTKLQRIAKEEARQLRQQMPKNDWALRRQSLQVSRNKQV